MRKRNSGHHLCLHLTASDELLNRILLDSPGARHPNAAATHHSS
jgi:hypothetical protein